MNVIIPTYKRWNVLAGKGYFGSVAQWVLPESQKDEYKKYLKLKQMVVIPDEMDGDISKKRNWILNNIDKPLIMMDDDVKRIEYLEGRVKDKSDFKVLPKEMFTDFLKMGFDLCGEFGTEFWGINQKPDSREYKEQLPFSLTNAILGPFMGFGKGFDLQFDESIPFSEDYDISIQALNKWRKVLRLNKFAYRGKHADNSGGVVSQRTLQREIDCCERVMRKWGSDIIYYKIPPVKRTDLLNGRVRVPIKGV